MMNELTSGEQEREIDAAVAEAMGFNVVATEWLCLNWNGRLEAYKTPDYNEPPYFIYVRGRPSHIETLRPVYVPKDGERWPPFQVRPVGEDEDIWFADVEAVPEYSTKYEVWATVERWMIENFTPLQKREYTPFLAELVNTERIFSVITAPLPLRCLAFLRAMGVDVSELVGVKG